MPPKRKAAASVAFVEFDDGESKEESILQEEKKEEPRLKKRYNLCQHGDCTTTASWGFADGKRIRCGPHRLLGMDDLVSKKCEAEGCGERPIYSFEQGRPTHCREHKSEDQFEVTTKKCAEPGCGKQCCFGWKGENALFCKDHREEGMIDVRSKKCAQSGCRTRPLFGWKGEDALFCKDHREEGMIDVKNKKCLEPGCDSQASKGPKGGKAQWCANHATDDMINLVNKLCEEPGCFKHATCGYIKGQPTHCRAHGDPEMEDVKSKRCQGPGCKKTSLTYGNHVTGRAFCATCRDPKIHWKLTTCKKEKCRKVATHSETGCLPFVFCETHASRGFSSHLETRCRKCNYPYICNEDGFCDDCTPSKKYEKVSENLMKAFFEEKGLTFEHNSASAGSACSDNRPDFVFRTPFGVLIVENDEKQHSDRLCECEQARMIGLREAFGGEPVHFIRFNPDLYKPIRGRKRTNKVHLGRRHEQLFDVLQSVLSDPETFFTRFPGLSVSYMYYDDCDTPESWRPNAIFY